MSHTSSCENADGITCVCPCGNTRHGHVLVRGFTSTKPADWAVASEKVEPHRWIHLADAHLRATSSSSSTERRPALNGIVSELISTLITGIEAHGHLDAVEVFAKQISDEVSDKFEQHLSGGKVPKSSNRHLWCVVLAAICRAYDEMTDFVSRSIDDIVADIVQWLREEVKPDRTDDIEVTAVYSRRTGIRRAFNIDAFDWLQLLIRHAVQSVKSAFQALGEEVAMKYLRLIGAVVCPDPERHPIVVKHCIWPLVQGPFRDLLEKHVSNEMRTWLRNAYPYLPQTTGGTRL